MWPIVWITMRTYAPYVTFPVAFVVGAVGYHLEWFIRGTPSTHQDERGVSEVREERRLAELAGQDSTEVLSLKDKIEFTPRAVLERNRPVAVLHMYCWLVHQVSGVTVEQIWEDLFGTVSTDDNSISMETAAKRP